VITQWHPERVREAALDELQANAEIVGKFVEEDARRRLYAIAEPEWGEKYRRLIVGRLLTNVVEREPKAIVITVGVAGGKKGRHYGFYIETGTRKQPAHPFLRPAVFDNGRKIVALLAGR
jgi:HK97 gp10 family phage protein